MSRLTLYKKNAQNAKTDFISTYDELSEVQQITDVTNSLTITDTTFIENPSYIISTEINELRNFNFVETNDSVELNPISGMTYTGGPVNFKTLITGKMLYMWGIFNNVTFSAERSEFVITIPYDTQISATVVGVAISGSEYGCGGGSGINITNKSINMAHNVDNLNTGDLTICLKYLSL